MGEKHYISAQQLLDDSFNLGLKVLESDFAPNYIVGIWRGGTPVGIAVQELLAYLGQATDHIAIRTSFYTGIAETAGHVKVHGLNYLVSRVGPEDRVLLVDDIFDTGKSVDEVIKELGKRCGDKLPQIRIATPYFKPANNQTDRLPDYYLHEVDEWLVFPHELIGLHAEEILANKPGIDSIRKRLEGMKNEE